MSRKPPEKRPDTHLRFLLWTSGVSFLLLLLFLKHIPAETVEGVKVLRPPYDVSSLAIQGMKKCCDTVWAGGADGLWAIDCETLKPREHIRCHPSLQNVRALLVDDQDNLWIGHHGGLSVLRDGTFRHYTKKGKKIPDNRVNALLQDRKGALWIGTQGGAVKVRNGVWKTYTKKDGLADSIVNVLYQDQFGDIWCGSAVSPWGGLSIQSGGEWQRFTTRDGLPHCTVNSIISDESGSVWVGTGLLDSGDGGACSFVRREGRWVLDKVLTRKDGLAGTKVRSLFCDEAGVLWYASEDSGIALYRKGQWKCLTRSQGLSHDEAQAFLTDPSGRLWIGTRDGITVIEKEALSSLVPHGQ